MGSIVKSVGKAIKKVGKGLKKVIKKIGPALLIAAAVYTGVAFYGAGTMAGGMGSLSTANFSAGLARIGQGIGGFASGLFSPSGSGAGVTNVAGNVMGVGAKSSMIGGTMTASGASSSAVAGATANALSGNAIVNKWVNVANTPSSGMTTGDALAYMTKWNMVQGGLEAWAASGRGKEESRQAEINRDHELQMLQMRLEMEATLAREGLEWDKEKMEAMYSYGGPSKKSGATQNKNWLSTHPATMAPAQTRGLLTQGAIPIQQIGEPTFGRQAPKNISYGGASGSPYSRKPQGLIEKGTAREFNPNSIRRYV